MKLKFGLIFLRAAVTVMLLIILIPITSKAGQGNCFKLTSVSYRMLTITYRQWHYENMLILPGLLTTDLKLMPASVECYVQITSAGVWAIISLFIIIFGFGLYEYLKMRTFKTKLEVLSKEMQSRDFCLEHLSKEREWLVEELHHRVKNNLQIVVSLLDSQSSYLTNPEANQAVKNSKHRMYTISLAHQMLYQADSLSIINMEAYINHILQYLQDECQSDHHIDFSLKTVPLSMSLSSAIPLGLIIHEAINNIFQYAFPKTTGGMVGITLSKDEHEEYCLKIADNGVGLPTELNVDSPDSLGIILMKGLSQQLHANFEIQNLNGVLINLKFKYISPQDYHLSD